MENFYNREKLHASSIKAQLFGRSHRYDLVKRINTSNETIKLARDDYAA